MDPVQFFAASRLVIVAGKGGVGKTTVTGALALAAARAGLSCLIVEVEGKSMLASQFGAPDFGYDEVTLCADQPGTVRARRITPDAALGEYLEDHGLKRISNRLIRTGALDVVATAAPGVEDILVLGKVKQLERSGTADVVIVDAPAAGHAIAFLQSARGLLDAVTVGPIRTQAADVTELLTDRSRCSVVLVTLPEETPVNELAETAYELEDRVGVGLGPVVVNGIYPQLDRLDADPPDSSPPDDAEALRAAAHFRLTRRHAQEEQVARLRSLLPLPQLHLPFLFSAGVGPQELAQLASAVTAQITAMHP
ncbi:MAG: ArsA-related P-loop ATPase [Acidimicrobiia bacterium]